MNCNYKAVIKRTEQQLEDQRNQAMLDSMKNQAKEAAIAAVEKQVDDIVFRTRNKMYLAMLEAGLSTRTLAKVQNKLFNMVEPWYQQYLANPDEPEAGSGVADFALEKRLHDLGIAIDAVKGEL